jgi:hypothetical protein
MSWRAAPAAARGIGEAAVDAVGAARTADAEAFSDATTRLEALDQVRVARVLGTVVRVQLEDLHPGGLTGDDLQVVLERCAWTARAWWRDVDPATLGALLLGAMGIVAQDDTPPSVGVPTHGALLIADLLTARGGGTLDPYLDRAFKEIEYAENDGP